MKMKTGIERGLEVQAKIILLQLIKAANEKSKEELLQEVYSRCETFARDYKCYSQERYFKRACEEYLCK